MAPAFPISGPVFVLSPEVFHARIACVGEVLNKRVVSCDTGIALFMHSQAQVPVGMIKEVRLLIDEINRF